MKNKLTFVLASVAITSLFFMTPTRAMEKTDIEATKKSADAQVAQLQNEIERIRQGLRQAAQYTQGRPFATTRPHILEADKQVTKLQDAIAHIRQGFKQARPAETLEQDPSQK